MLLYVLGSPRGKNTHHMISTKMIVLEEAKYDTIETTVRTRRLLWSGAVVSANDVRLSRRVVLEKLEASVGSLAAVGRVDECNAQGHNLNVFRTTIEG